jgi:hypothetical protein
MSHAASDAFFTDLRDAYLVVLEESVRPSSGPFSVSLAAKKGVLAYPSLPDALWKELSVRLTKQGKDVAGYVKAQEITWKKGEVIHRPTGRRAVIFHVIELKWLGDQRLLITHCRTTGSLSAHGYTTVLEKNGRGWHIVDRIDSFFANKSVETNRRPASPLTAGRQFGGASCALRSRSAAVRESSVGCLRRWKRTIVLPTIYSSLTPAAFGVHLMGL